MEHTLERQNVFGTTLHSDHYSDCKSYQTGLDSALPPLIVMMI